MPIFLPFFKGQGPKSLVSISPQGKCETNHLHHLHHLHQMIKSGGKNHPKIMLLNPFFDHFRWGETQKKVTTLKLRANQVI